MDYNKQSRDIPTAKREAHDPRSNTHQMRSTPGVAFYGDFVSLNPVLTPPTFPA